MMRWSSVRQKISRALRDQAGLIPPALEICTLVPLSGKARTYTSWSPGFGGRIRQPSSVGREGCVAIGGRRFEERLRLSGSESARYVLNPYRLDLSPGGGA